MPNSIIKKMGSIKQVILDAGDCTTIQSRISDDIANVIRRTTKAAIDIFGGVPGSEVVNVENPAACTLWGYKLLLQLYPRTYFPLQRLRYTLVPL